MTISATTRTGHRPGPDRRTPARPLPVVGRSGRTWERDYVGGLVLADAAAALLAGIGAYAVRFGAGASPGDTIAYTSLAAALPLLWVLAMWCCRAYEPRFLGVGSEEFRRVASAGLGLAAAVGTTSWALQLEVARGFVAVALPTALLLTLVQRYALRQALHRRRALGECRQRVVALGRADDVAALVRRMRRAPYHGLDVVAACVPRHAGLGGSAALDDLDVPVLGELADVVAVVEAVGADSVAVIGCPELDGAVTRRLAWQLEETSADLIVAPPLIEVVGPRIAIRPVCGLPLLHVERPELVGIRRVGKSAVDRLIAAAALVALSPLLIGIAVAIRLDSSGPVLFRQVRVGRGGAPFRILKFRTMGVDAEHRLIDLREHNEGGGPLFKLRTDPRVTRTGRWLRRYSLDELPQLLNVLRGDMSLVGPRPPLPSEAAEYGVDARRRLLVKPGLTGLWQINGRSDLDWEESVRLDLRYVENWSLAFDLIIIWKTAFAVVRGRGAY